MQDEMHFTMPLMLSGKLAEVLFVRERLSVILAKRNTPIKIAAEGSAEI
jgi:hypothetical protein